MIRNKIENVKAEITFVFKQTVNKETENSFFHLAQSNLEYNFNVAKICS